VAGLEKTTRVPCGDNATSRARTGRPVAAFVAVSTPVAARQSLSTAGCDTPVDCVNARTSPAASKPSGVGSSSSVPEVPAAPPTKDAPASPKSTTSTTLKLLAGGTVTHVPTANRARPGANATDRASTVARARLVGTRAVSKRIVVPCRTSRT
jgi:hypothetical protein